MWPSFQYHPILSNNTWPYTFFDDFNKSNGSASKEQYYQKLAQSQQCFKTNCPSWRSNVNSQYRLENSSSSFYDRSFSCYETNEPLRLSHHPSGVCSIDYN